MVEGFLSSLGPELESKVRDRFPKTLREAYQLSVMLEGNTLFHSSSQASGKHKVHVDDYAGVVSGDVSELESDLDELREEVRCLQEARVRKELYSKLNELRGETSSVAAEKFADGTQRGQHGGSSQSKSFKVRSTEEDLHEELCKLREQLQRVTVGQGKSGSGRAVQRMDTFCDSRACNADDRVYVTARLGSAEPRKMLADTGGSRNLLMSSSTAGLHIQPTMIQLVAGNGTEIRVTGQTVVDVHFVNGHREVSLPVEFLVSPDVETDILSRDFLCRHVTSWNFKENFLVIEGVAVPLISSDDDSPLAQLNVMAEVQHEGKVIPPRLPRGCTAEEVSVKQVDDHGTAAPGLIRTDAKIAVTNRFDLFGGQRRGQIFRINDDVIIAQGVVFRESKIHSGQNNAPHTGRKTDSKPTRSFFVEFLVFEMKFVQEAVDDGGKDDADNADQRDAAVERVTAGENFSAIGLQRGDRPMPERIIAAFTNASTHGNFSKA